MTTARRRFVSPAAAVVAAVVVVAVAACGPSATRVSSNVNAATPPTVAATAGPSSTTSSTTTPTTSATVPATTRSTIALVTTSIPPPTTLGTVPVGRSGIDGTVVFGPVCPVERVPPDPACAPRPGPAHIRVVRAADGLVVTGEAGSDGRFSIPASPGTYAVMATAASPGPGRGCQADPAQVTVTTGSVSMVTVTCDTGIR